MKGRKISRRKWVELAVLRYEGYGLKTIAGLLGLPVSTAETIARREEYKTLESRVYEKLDMDNLSMMAKEGSEYGESFESELSQIDRHSNSDVSDERSDRSLEDVIAGVDIQP